MKTRAWLLLLIAAVIVATVWLTWRRLHPRPAVVTIQDGKTIDFSSGKPVIKDDAKEAASIQRAVSEMDAAAANVTFTPTAKPNAPSSTAGSSPSPATPAKSPR